LFSISMSLKHTPSPVKVVLPPEADEVLRQDFVCSSCSSRYSTIGHGYFCPACGHNSAIRDFEHTLELSRKAIQAIPTIAETSLLIECSEPSLIRLTRLATVRVVCPRCCHWITPPSIQHSVAPLRIHPHRALRPAKALLRLLPIRAAPQQERLLSNERLRRIRNHRPIR
jgi:predicted RNA-binding Zn-ribbon protein involved in translation (DUF1610 family)